MSLFNMWWFQIIFGKFLNEKLRTESKTDPLFHHYRQRLEYYITLTNLRESLWISDTGNTDKKRQRVIVFWTNWSQKGPLGDLCHNRTKSGRFLMAFHCIKFLFWHFDIKLASADFFINELSEQKHQPNKGPRLDTLGCCSSRLSSIHCGLSSHKSTHLTSN